MKRQRRMKRRVLVTAITLGITFSSLNIAQADIYVDDKVVISECAMNFKPVGLPVVIGMNKNDVQDWDKSQSVSDETSFYESFITDKGDVVTYSGCKDIITGIRVEFLSSVVSFEEVMKSTGLPRTGYIDVKVADEHLYRWDSEEYSILVSLHADNTVTSIGVCNVKAATDNTQVIGYALGDRYDLLDIPVVVETEENTDLINDLNGEICIKASGNVYKVTLGLTETQLEVIKPEDYAVYRDGEDYYYRNPDTKDTLSIELSQTVSAVRIDQLIQERKLVHNLEYIDADTEMDWTNELYAALGGINEVYSVGVEYSSTGDLELEAIPRNTTIDTLKEILGEPYVRGANNIWRVRDRFLTVQYGLDGSIVSVQIE